MNESPKNTPIAKTIKRRADEYDTQKNLWVNKGFKTTIDDIEIEKLSWEQIITTIKEHDPVFLDQIQEFYNFCLHFNSTIKNEPSDE